MATSTRTTHSKAPSRATEPLPFVHTGSASQAAPASSSAIARLAVVQEQTRQLATSGIFIRVVAALLAVDAVLIVFHTLRVLLRKFESQVRMFESSMFSISYDFTYGEIFGYLKSIAITSCFLTCYFRARSPIFAALGFTFGVILLDDSLQIHETLGERLAAALALGPMAGLQPHDLGELIVWSGLGAVVVLVLAVGFLRSDALNQNIALIFLGLLAVLIFFAVGADALHVALPGSFRGAGFISGVLEDGGEMVALSVICAAAVAVAWGCSSDLVRPGPSAGRPLP